MGSRQKAIYHFLSEEQSSGFRFWTDEWEMLHPDANNLTLKLNEKQVSLIGDSFSVDKVFKKKCL